MRAITICSLLVSMTMGMALNAVAMSAQKAHELIEQQRPELLETDELVSLYYFGREESVSVVGLERVGQDYLPVRWLLLFENEQLLGWYHPLPDFPARLEDGQLHFPKGSSIESLGIRSPRPLPMVIDNQHMAFHSIQ